MIKNIIASLLLVLLFAGCKKNLLEKNEYWNDVQPSNAYVKFIHAYNSLYPSIATPANGPTVDFTVNGIKVSGVNATGAGVAYTGIFPITSGEFVSIPAGTANIKTILTRTTGTALPTDVVSDASFTLNAGSYYSAFLVDTLPFPLPGTPNMVMLPENGTRAKVNFFKVRFAQMIPTTDTLEIYSKNNLSVLISNVTFKKASDFIEMPLLPKNDTLQLRKKGTTTILAEYKPFLPATERVYTIFSRGLYNTTSGPRARTLTAYTNQ